MNQWITIFQKEMIENWRNKKWIWVPLVVILLAVMDPISTYYLPQIMESVGGLPDGTLFEMPEMAPAEVIMMSFGQLSSLGVLVFVLISMATISGEIKSGVAELILVKPVSFANYITAKWAALLLLVWGALIIGMFVSWYYINILFGDLSFMLLIKAIFFYGLWLTLLITISILYNTLFKTPGLIAFMTIATIMIMSIITNIFGHILTWSPNNLSIYIQDMLLTNKIPNDLFYTSLVTIGLVCFLLIASIYTFKNKQLIN